MWIRVLKEPVIFHLAFLRYLFAHTSTVLAPGMTLTASQSKPSFPLALAQIFSCVSPASPKKQCANHEIFEALELSAFLLRVLAGQPNGESLY